MDTIAATPGSPSPLNLFLVRLVQDDFVQEIQSMNVPTSLATKVGLTGWIEAVAPSFGES